MNARPIGALSLLLGTVLLVAAHGLAEPEKPPQGAPAGASSWERLKLPEAVAKSALHSVFFVDAKHGWVVGEKGLCLATKDGGDSWEAQKTGSGATLRCVWFQDAKTGWACGNGDPNAPKTGGHVVLSRPLKAGTLLTTTDGGKSWTGSWIPTNFDIPWIEASAAPLLQVGVSGGESHLDGDITRSPDGGKTWKSNRCFRSLFAVRRIDDKRWLAVGSAVSVGFLPTPTSELYTNKRCRALYSADGGETWKVSKGSDGKSPLRAVAADTKRGALAVGDDGTILRTEDQCEHWSAAASGTEEDLTAVAWVSGTANTVVAVGDEGMFLVSDDGGKKWKALAVPTTVALLSVTTAGDYLVVAGRDGTLLRVPVKQLSSLPARAPTPKKEKKKKVDPELRKLMEELEKEKALERRLEALRKEAKKLPPDSEEAKQAEKKIKEMEAALAGKPFVGVTFAPNTTQVEQVFPKGPAEVAGIQKGDVLVKWGAAKIDKVQDLAAALQAQKPGDKVDVEIERDGKVRKISVEVGKRPRPLAKE
jgi:photosystem II stability/assembly factor-like uncharacterized protein